MKIYGAALAREPRKPSPFCDCLNKAKITFHLTDGTRRIFVCFAVGTGRYAGHKAPGKTEWNAVLRKKFSHAPDTFRKTRWQKTRLARNCREANSAAVCREREERGKSGTARGNTTSCRRDINRRLPVTGQGKMEFLLRICLCHVPGVTRVRRLV